MVADSLCLTPDELYDLTHYKRTAAQIRALDQMRIDHLLRPDGSVVVFRHSLPGLPDKDIEHQEENKPAVFGV